MSYLTAFLARKQTNAVAVLRTPDGAEGNFSDGKPQNLTAKTDKSLADIPFVSFGSSFSGILAEKKAEPEPDAYGAELAEQTRAALRVRFTGADAETAWPAVDFYATAGRLAEARYVVSLCADEKMRRVWLAQFDAYESDQPSRQQYAAWQAQNMDGLRRLRDHDEAAFLALIEEVEERAGIQQFDGGLDRAEAEHRAEWETLWLRFGLAAISMDGDYKREGKNV